MRQVDRKAAVADYKERKVVAGIYALGCVATGQVWVGGAPNIDTIQNRHWFTLRHGGHPGRILQAAWNAHGADGFSFTVLEHLDADVTGYGRDVEMKARLAHWRTALEASTI